MIHLYKKGKSNNTLLLLHGTGGNEHDLLEIAKMIDNKANILSVRGNVIENNMPRFFRRLRPGIFDLEDLMKRTDELNSFINESSIKYKFDRKNVIAVGFSNGANIAANMLFQIKDSLRAAILLRPMVPRRDILPVDLSNTKVFISAGINDDICLPSESRDLKEMLENSKCNVHFEWINSNHSLTYGEFSIIKEWYNLNLN